MANVSGHVTTLETVKLASRQVSWFQIIVSELSNHAFGFSKSHVESDFRISNRSRPSFL